MFEKLNRRDFLASGAGALSATVFQDQTDLMRLLALFPGASRPTAQSDPSDNSPDAEMIVYSRKFLTMEMSMAALTSWITPTKNFFVRNNAIMPSSIDVGKWELRITGEVRKPVTLNFRDLAALTKKSVTNTMECAGNGRAFYDPRIGGVPWRKGAVGNATFEGPRLRDLLRLAGVNPFARHVAFTGLDTAPEGAERFIRSIPLEKAVDENSLVATHMNGAPLTMPHGFPARALIPGWIGSASIKWLQEITVLDHEYLGAYMDPGYRVPTEQLPNHSPKLLAERKTTLPLTSLRLKSIIAKPDENTVINLSEGRNVSVRGAVWGGEKPVASVEISTDGGRTWQAAVLGPDHARYAWRLWEYEWKPPASGSYQVVSRARDIDGNRQPVKPAWNAGGYLWNGMDRITVQVQT
jgi:DMSO/TMAO reductase YedYZ molybdopterin-dependent catalytic subunit